MGNVDNRAMESRSGAGCDNSDYRFVQTSCCGRVFVEDAELQELYVDAADVTRRISLLRVPSEPAPRCPACASPVWYLADVNEPTEVPPEWTWACDATFRR
jgi:hypothetical protein